MSGRRSFDHGSKPRILANLPMDRQCVDDVADGKRGAAETKGERGRETVVNINTKDNEQMPIMNMNSE